LLATYLNFTRQQEMVSPALGKFRETVNRTFHGQIPDWLAAQYRDAARPAFKFWSVLMTNTRMLLLFVVLLVDRPAWFFWVEITIFNLLLLGLLNWQERMCRSLLQLMRPAAQP
jgi:hypothetical protein